MSQPCTENDEKVTLFEVIPDTLEESLRQVLSKEDNVRLDHSSTFRKSASGNLHIGNKCLEEEQSINVNLGLVFLHQDSLFDPGLNKFITIPDSIKKVFLCNSALCFSLHFWSNLTILLPTVDAMSSIEGTMCLDKLLITNACLKFEHDKLGGKHHITSLSKVSIFWV